jgi:hypothetical protein
MEDTLIYKRTHRGDPDEAGIFGIHDCMGKVRDQAFDAVIGVGGKRPDRGHEGIARKINWVGIGTRKTEAPIYRLVRNKFVRVKGPLVAFDYFVLLEESGPYLEERAPNLFRHMFGDQHVRHLMSRNLPDGMREEVRSILRWAKNRRPTRSRAVEKKLLAKREC